MLLIVFLALYAVLHVWVYATIVSGLALSVVPKIAIALWFTIMIAGPFLARRFERQGWEKMARIWAWVGYLWMGIVFLFGMIAMGVRLFRWLADTVHSRMLIDLALSPQQTFWASAVLTAFLVPYAFLERSQVRLEKITIPTDKDLDGNTPIRVAQISDVHIGLMSGASRIRRIVSDLRACTPDVIVSTGDLLDANLKTQMNLANEFRALSPRFGMFAVLGNHECYAGLEASIAFMEQAGFTLLRNRSVVAGGVQFVGLDDPAADRAGNWREQELQTLVNVSKRFTVLLKHRPDVLPTSLGHFDIQLSGHTHKGQIFPFNLLTRLRYPAHAGLFRLPDAYLYVSRGTGSWGPPLRLLASPEITLIEIHSARSLAEVPVLAPV